jgi:hypothetical protein
MESSQKDVEEDTSDNIAVSGEESSIVEDRESSHKAELKNANVPTVLGPDKRKKRRQAAVGNIPSEVKSLTDMASSATKVLSQLANKNTTNNSRDGDADWDFCKLMYAKMKSIPDGDLKDELQLEIQRLILQTKKRSATQGMNPPASFGSQVSRSSSEPQGCAKGYPAQSYPNQAWSCNQDNYQPCGTYQQMLQDANSVNDQFHYMN